MRIKQAKFIKSSPNLKSCPDFKGLSEFALLGRSNVGKSSFINKITNNSKLAKTSNTPGKTRLINFFLINENFVIADLPGYGYAKVSKTEQESWQKNLEEYLLKRGLVSTIQFIDSRHEVQKNDIQMHEWLKFNKIEVFVVLTKADYVSKNELSKRIKEAERLFDCKVFPFSTKEKRGIEEILEQIESYSFQDTLRLK